MNSTAGSRSRRRFAALLGAALVLAAVGLAVLTVNQARGKTRAATSPSLSKLVGQRLVVAFSGTTADPSLLARVKAGQVGGVILFGSNVSTPAQVTALAKSLQTAAAAGGNPPLIISTDQEGGLVKRIPWAPPNRSAEQLGQLPTSQVQQSGAETAAALRKDGINVDLAPVADVPAGPQDFIQQQHRAFSTNRFTVSLDAAAFATGLEQGKVWPTLKHFPGLGLATVSTDQALVTINASKATLMKGVLPYQVAIRRKLHSIVMLSTAVYPALDYRAPAWSPPILKLLRGTLGFAGVTITDSLDSAAAVRHQSVSGAALRSAQAGTDLVLITGSEAESAGVYAKLLAAARSGALPMSNLTTSYNRIVTLKSRL
ncbi:MAG: glycoside hydrolase family 3 N-terminal domain-containing protein [Gaiellales bacterium]